MDLRDPVFPHSRVLFSSPRLTLGKLPESVSPVILKSTGEFLGDCGITMQNIWEDGERYPEIGYHIVRKHQNRGYASEAASACVRYAFEQLGMSEVYSKQRSDNEASRRVALNAGMSLRREYTAGNGVGKSIYSIKKDEYFGKQS